MKNLRRAQYSYMIRKLFGRNQAKIRCQVNQRGYMIYLPRRRRRSSWVCATAAGVRFVSRRRTIN